MIILLDGIYYNIILAQQLFIILTSILENSEIKYKNYIASNYKEVSKKTYLVHVFHIQYYHTLRH